MRAGFVCRARRYLSAQQTALHARAVEAYAGFDSRRRRTVPGQPQRIIWNGECPMDAFGRRVLGVGDGGAVVVRTLLTPRVAAGLASRGDSRTVSKSDVRFCVDGLSFLCAERPDDVRLLENTCRLGVSRTVEAALNAIARQARRERSPWRDRDVVEPY